MDKIHTTFVDELNIIKNIESLGGKIHTWTPCCDDDFIVNWWGGIPINDLDLTIAEALELATIVGNFIGIDMFPVITANGIALRFSFNTVVNEEYATDDRFDLYMQYR